MTIPTLADHLAGKLPKVSLAPATRIHIIEDEAPRPVGRPPNNPPKEEPMPRKKRVSLPVEEGARVTVGADPNAMVAKKRGPRPHARGFAVWNDGTVEIRTSACAGSLAPEEAAELVDYIQRLRGPSGAPL